MMLSHERRHGIRFDRVARVRLDAQWWHSAPPYCFLSPSSAYSEGGDHFWLIPRDGAERAFDVYGEYLRCGNGHVSRHHVEAGIAVRCCGGGPTALFVGAMRRAWPIRSDLALTNFPGAGAEHGRCSVPLLPGSVLQTGLWGLHLVRVASSSSTTTTTTSDDTRSSGGGSGGSGVLGSGGGGVGVSTPSNASGGGEDEATRREVENYMPSLTVALTQCLAHVHDRCPAAHVHVCILATPTPCT